MVKDGEAWCAAWFMGLRRVRHDWATEQQFNMWSVIHFEGIFVRGVRFVSHFCFCMWMSSGFSTIFWKDFFSIVLPFLIRVKYQLTLYVWVNFWALYSISLTYSFTSTSVLITVTVWKWQLLSCVRLCVTPWTVACQAPLSMEFARQEYWGGLPFPSPGDLPNLDIKPRSPVLQADSLPSEPPGKPKWWN